MLISFRKGRLGMGRAAQQEIDDLIHAWPGYLGLNSPVFLINKIRIGGYLVKKIRSGDWRALRVVGVRRSTLMENSGF